MPWRGPEYEGEYPSLGWQLLDIWHEVFPSPRNENEPFLCTDRQALDIVEWYAIHPVTGKFVYRRGCSQEAKGTGKSPIEGAKCISELGLPVVFDGWDANGEPVARPWGTNDLPQAWVQIASLSEDQDDNTWTPLLYLLTARDGYAADLLGIDAGLTRCYLKGSHGAKIEPVTSRAGSREGQPITYAVLDETGYMTPTNGGVKLARTVRRNAAKMGGRCYETTNGYPPGEQTVAEDTHKASQKQGDILYLSRQAPHAIDGVEVTEASPDHVLAAALQTPYAGCWWTDTDRIVSDMRDMPWGDGARFFLNWNVSPETVFIDGAHWARRAVDRTVEPGEQIALGFDGSINNDSTMLYGCTRDGFIFELATWERPRDTQGLPVKGWKVPREEVHQAVADAFEQYDVGRMFCDPAKWWSEIEQWDQRYGKDRAKPPEPKVVALDTNQTRRFAPACGRFVVGIAEETITHDGKPTLSAHLAAAVRKKVRVNDDDEDGRTMFVIVKADTRKIDAAVAAVLAYEAAATLPAKRKLPNWQPGWK